MMEDRLGYPVGNSPAEDGIMTVPHLIKQGSMTFGPAWVKPVDIEWVSMWSVLAVGF
jgi:hypothetical protein